MLPGGGEKRVHRNEPRGKEGPTSRYDVRSALIVVDVQNDFAHPEGALYVSGGEDVVPVINEEISQALDAGAVVIYTQDWHPPETPHFQAQGGLWPAHCVQDTGGAELAPDLHVAGQVVRKGSGAEDGYSGFTVEDRVTGERRPTKLEEVLRARRIESVVIVGLATDYCVQETVLDALGLGFETAVRADAVRAVNLEPGDGTRALDAMRAAGARIENPRPA